jgi:thiol:disulfide interchange protein DsbD
MFRPLISRLFPSIFLTLALAAPGAVRAALFELAPPPVPVKAELVGAEMSVQPGRAFTIALRLDQLPPWHTYWKYAGTGYATKLTWDLPPGWTVGPIQWPTPGKLMDAQGVITGNGYEGVVYLPVTVTPPAGVTPGGTVSLKAKAEWLMCSPEQCVPGEAQVALTLPVRAEAPETDPAHGAGIAAALAALPRDPGGWQVRAERAGKTIRLRLTAQAGASLPAPVRPWFFPDKEFVQFDKPQVFREEGPGDYVFELTLSPYADAGATRLTGVLRTEGSWAAAGGPVTGLPIDVPLAEGSDLSVNVVSPATAEGAVAVPAAGLAGTLLLAFFGGLILNLMPCVFPVLGIKILGFVHQAGADRRKVVVHGLAFTAGVLLSFWVLAGVLIALRHGGKQLGTGWGFQLQSPVFVFMLAVVMLGFALNLSGVFELGLAATAAGGSLQAKQGFTGSFFTGVLATVVATPCSAPLVGTALGAALTLPEGEGLLVFTFMGLGLSTPYLALSAFPGAVKWLPRPGAWMETFKQFMAFPLYATTGYLVWVLSGQVGKDGLLNTVFGLTGVALAAWCYGRFAAPGSRPGRARFGLAAGLGLLAFGLWLGWPRSPASDDIAWEPWSAERAAQLHAGGRPVYVDFTALWCPTCQANKRVVFGSAEVRRVFHDRHVATLEADWTNFDPKIAAELAKWGRVAVPFNLLWLPGQTEPKPLPSLLSPGIVLEALGK